MKSNLKKKIKVEMHSNITWRKEEKESKEEQTDNEMKGKTREERFMKEKKLGCEGKKSKRD